MKRILCYGDSNTYGADGRRYRTEGMSLRYDEQTRWTALLQKNLGSDYLISEEGFNGRTTVFDDPMENGRNGFAYLDVIFGSHQPLDLVILMLGTNDTKPHFSASSLVIARGMERIILRLKELIRSSINPEAKILLLAPPHIERCENGEYMYEFDESSTRKSHELAAQYAMVARNNGCLFADTSKWVSPDPTDGIHQGPDAHKVFAQKLTEILLSVL